ncbi:hypothetical protein H1Q78_18280 [Cellulosimicrobium cellulans]|uniref:hypothetical protein n=1 Tax=Cellulosimicrobium cellulans TaxID=1710 RepID=UPI001EDBC50D|nr:hypothetical protein [Cellulosimicrobium cellulans]UKJ63553.1 hypothetical protein H1Q78_18280 [Cellulosimicrobium cellulans]
MTAEARIVKSGVFTFVVEPDAHQLDVLHLTIAKGPNVGYGFSVRSNAEWPATSLQNLVDEFVEGLDPATGVPRD